MERRPKDLFLRDSRIYQNDPKIGMDVESFVENMWWPRLVSLQGWSADFEKEEKVLPRDPQDIFCPLCAVGLDKGGIARLVGDVRCKEFAGFVIGNLPGIKPCVRVITSGQALLRIHRQDTDPSYPDKVYCVGPDRFTFSGGGLFVGHAIAYSSSTEFSVKFGEPSLKGKARAAVNKFINRI